MADQESPPSPIFWKKVCELDQNAVDVIRVLNPAFPIDDIELRNSGQAHAHANPSDSEDELPSPMPATRRKRLRRTLSEEAKDSDDEQDNTDSQTRFVPARVTWNREDISPDDVGKVLMLDMVDEKYPNDVGYCTVLKWDRKGDHLIQWFYTQEQLTVDTSAHTDQCVALAEAGGRGIFLTDHTQTICFEDTLAWADVTDHVIWQNVPARVAKSNILTVVTSISFETGDECNDGHVAEFYLKRLLMFGQSHKLKYIDDIQEMSFQGTSQAVTGMCDACESQRALTMSFKHGNTILMTGVVCGTKIVAAIELSKCMAKGYGTSDAIDKAIQALADEKPE